MKKLIIPFFLIQIIILMGGTLPVSAHMQASYAQESNEDVAVHASSNLNNTSEGKVATIDIPGHSSRNKEWVYIHTTLAEEEEDEIDTSEKYKSGPVDFIILFDWVSTHYAANEHSGLYSKNDLSKYSVPARYLLLQVFRL